MAFKRKYVARRKSFRRRTFKRRRFGRANFSSRVKRVLMKATETKYLDSGFENSQLYHNTGQAGFAFVGPSIFNPWQNITNGNNRATRIGDKITPRGMKVKIWLANKLDRPNLLYRIVACICPRMYNGAVVTAGSIDPAPAFTVGTTGNYMVLPFDKEKNIKVMFDKTYRVESGQSGTAAGVNKECHREVNLWFNKKGARAINFDNGGRVLNNYFALYIIPYDSYGSLTTDNIASCSVFYRMYWKDI